MSSGLNSHAQAHMESDPEERVLLAPASHRKVALIFI